MFKNLPKCAVLKQKDAIGRDINTVLVHGSVPKARSGKNIIKEMSKLNNKDRYSLKKFDPNRFNFMNKDNLP